MTTNKKKEKKIKVSENLTSGRAILAFVWKDKLYKKGIIFNRLPDKVVRESFEALGRVMYKTWEYITLKKRKCCEQHSLACGVVDTNGEVWRCCNSCDIRPRRNVKNNAKSN